MMGRFGTIAGWELRTARRRISTWVYFGIFLLLGFLMMTSAAGAWDNVTLSLGGGGKVLATAPYSLMATIGFVALFGVSVTAAVSGQALYRDYEAAIHPLLYTTPVSKLAFFGGRFTGALLVNLVIMLGIGVGCLIATLMPWVDADKIGAFRLMSYVQPYLTLILPNLLITASIFFALAALTRQMLPNYVGAVVLLIGYLIGTNLTSDLSDRKLAALLDPFGIQAMASAVRYWSIADKNARLVPLEGLLLTNRLLWSAVAIAILALAYRRFRFAHVAVERKGRKRPLVDSAPAELLAGTRHLRLPEVARDFGRGAHLTQFLSIARRSFWGIVKNRYFIAIVAAGLLFLVFTASEAGNLYGTPTWPVTYQMEELLSGTFGLFILVIITFYAGELVWAERDLKVSQIQDATPIPTAVTMLGKFVALAGVIAVLLIGTMLCGIVTQALKGYTNFEIGLYLQSLFGMRYVDYVLLAVMAMTIHVLVNHKYVGHLLVLLFYIGTGLLGAIGLEHNLYAYGSDGGVQYSDMNGFGHYVRPFLVWKLYWGLFAILLAVLTTLFWVRGTETRARWRARLAASRFHGVARVITAVAALGFLGLGGFIFYNTNVLNEYRTSKERLLARAEYEKRYKKFEGTAQPRITAATLQVDIFPESRAVRARGTYVLRNKTREAVDTLHVRIPNDLEIRALELDRPSRRVLDDRERSYHMIGLETPLAPADSMVLRFDLASEPRGFANEVGGTEIVENGSFINSRALLPSIGYSDDVEISDDDARKKRGLAPKPRAKPPTDLAARQNSYIANDADWLDFDATVSTSPDQIAIAPGYLQREWTEGGRRYFHYRMDAPILNFYAFQSARYAVRKDVWKAPPGAAPSSEVAIEIYYHPGHEYNLDRMVRAVQQSLDYFTANFGPYQHRQLRIIEFPRYAMFAQSFPNTIPYSESIGFIARITDDEDVDYPFYVTAHEVAHQWWAHQVIGGNVQGSTMLSETMSQYSALMVMEKEYGARRMKKFLEYELDRYLFGRGAERKKEQPLVLVEDQPYIHYRKGSVVMYALRDYLGEERLNGALSRYLAATKFQQPPYTTALELLDTLRAATPDSLHYVLEDLLETITLYEVRTDSASVVARPDGRWDVALTVTAKKLRADSLGNETELPMAEWIDVGVYADTAGNSGKYAAPFYLQKHRVTSGTQRLTVTVDKQPTRAGADPLHKLIDRQTEDNVVRVRQD